MHPDTLCTGKDKQPLVLLALGLLILLSHVLPSRDRQNAHGYAWLEIRDGSSLEIHRVATGAGLNPPGQGAPVFAGDSIRSDAGLIEQLSQGRAAGLLQGRDGGATVVPVSPRLSFMLGQPFSVNQANAEDLTLIPGIGKNLSAKIIAFIQSNGPIADIAQLDAVPGIGARKIDNLRKYVTP